MRIVTRPDFDGIVCAALLYEAEPIDAPVYWIEPGDVQSGQALIKSGDIIANLPYDDRCALWFDHHLSNRIDRPFSGNFKIAPSAAGLVFETYKDRFTRDFTPLVIQTDRIDSANLTAEEIQRPEINPYLILSMTIPGAGQVDEPYWNRLVSLLRTHDIHRILSEPDVKERVDAKIEENRHYEQVLKKHTWIDDSVSVTDFRSLENHPSGNRFLVYTLFPQCMVNLKLRKNVEGKNRITLNAGHSIINRTCRVPIGKLLQRYGGGGHAGAGSCRIPASEFEEKFAEIMAVFKKNQPMD